MEKLDRLGWAAGLAFTAYGIAIGLRVNRPEAMEQFLERLPPGWRPSSSPTVERMYSIIDGGGATRPGLRRFNLLYVNSSKLVRTLDSEEMLGTFETNLQLFVAEFARRRVFVHAGVVGWKGRAIVIPGLSNSGKTTLVAELVKAGASYYSDEFAVLDLQGRVHPYPKPLGLRAAAGGKQTPTPVESLGGRVGARPLPVGLVVASQYKTGARWRPRRLTAGQGMLTLLANTVSAREKPERNLLVLQRVVTTAPVMEGRRGEAREIADALLKQLDRLEGDCYERTNTGDACRTKRQTHHSSGS
jgi:hypothetical protein